MKKEFENYDDATDALARCFIDKYFYKEYVEEDDYYFIGSQDQDRNIRNWKKLKK